MRWAGWCEVTRGCWLLAEAVQGMTLEGFLDYSILPSGHFHLSQAQNQQARGAGLGGA